MNLHRTEDAGCRAGERLDFFIDNLSGYAIIMIAAFQVEEGPYFYHLRECWNRQTGTFEGRVSMTYGFKSRLSHHAECPYRI